MCTWSNEFGKISKVMAFQFQTKKKKKKVMLIMSFSGDDNCYQGCFT